MGKAKKPAAMSPVKKAAVEAWKADKKTKKADVKEEKDAKKTKKA
jgi:hypothetical protein